MWTIFQRGRFVIAALMMLSFVTGVAAGDNPWVVYQGKNGPGKGKHIVLISGDEEYRSEEALPQLGKILAVRHGFKCTVLFAIDPKTGVINPNNQNNIPGLEALKTADLMIIATRFRSLADEQMKHIDDYLRSGKPVIGMRTATHAFMIRGDSAYKRYSNGYGGDKKEWTGGFGRLVLGEKWISHHGRHKHEATRGVIADDAKDHPITRGIKDGDIWGPTDVYGVRLPLPGDSKPIVFGQVTKRKGDFDPKDRLFGMRPDDPPLTDSKKNSPMMPVAWLKSYQLPAGKKGRAFATTMGAATDLEAEGTRRMIVNAVYYLLGMDVPRGGTNVQLVGQYQPSPYGFHRGDYFLKKGVRPSDYRLDK